MTTERPAASCFYEQLTPDNAAMLLIDHQVGTLLFGISDIDPVNLKNNALYLAEVAELFNLPTILTTSNPNGPNGPLFPELIEKLPDSPIIDRVIINAWNDPNFVAAVEKTGRQKLIMAGVTTDVCLAFPAISAVGAGYDVYAVIDASGTWNETAQRAAIARMTQAGVKCVNTIAVAAELQKDWTLPSAPGMGKIFAERLPSFGFVLAGLEHTKQNVT
ncbi:MAG: hydrolase [Pelatocladus maniniholoensis HA4357-MV3]|jgi:nicotinamidase-related amidase|uniref:Hydrolase n=1 Tax=Pelatocladus maniniholoensis HA4357-MV3 TaxID=1117104 RepID=A0A9E3H5F0_9NOST|nr:hydrolase [Pelatocladus maniniholoensis HA4357-MV3]BAZ65512.1 isochorismatase hydrolase [Fischerella sp. NIES-4106]